MKDKLKAKVIFGFSLAILLVLAASFVTITNFLQLKDTVQTLSVPDVKLTKLNKILTDISEAESIVRSYTLTNNVEYLHNYNRYSDIIDQEIDSLKRMTISNPPQFKKIDSISSLWDAKTRNFSAFIELKNTQRNNDLASRAIDKISREAVNDSTKVKSTTTTKRTEVIETRVKPELPKAEIKVKPKDYSGALALIKKIFGKKEEKVIEIPPAKDPQTITEKSVTYDTLSSEIDAKSVIDNVIDILSDLQYQENRFQQMVNSKEIDLLQQDILIMGHIRTMIKELQKEELGISYQQSQQSKQIAEKSIFTIFIIGLSGMLISVIFIFLILNDITKSNYYKNKLVIAKRKAEKLAKVKEEFLANMSHEIRTPLSAILGFTEQMFSTGLKDKQHYYLQAVKNSSEHLLSTVNDILDFSKLESGQLKFEQVPFNLRKQLDEVNQIFRMRAEEKNLQLKIHMDDQLDQVMVGDPFRLKQILINLVANALKFTEKGSVEIAIRQIEGSRYFSRLRIDVKDTGIGISKQQIPYIFRDFNQADTSITRKYGGTGLGLAICKRLVEMQKGRIYVKSTVGKGSTFSVELKYKLGKPSDLVKEVKTSLNPQILAGKRVLVIDDDEYNILLFHTILNKWKMKVDLASNGREGAELVFRKKYDLVLTDIHMPELSGIQLVKEIRKKENNNRQVPVIAITANVIQKDLNAYLKTGFNGYVLKPFKEIDLYQEIVSVMQLDTDGMELLAEQIVPENKDVDPDIFRGFDLSDIEAFADGDKNAVASMLSGLIENNRISLYQLNQNLNHRNWQQIGAVAHKMLPSFNHLKAVEVVEKLKKIETLVRQKEYAAIPGLVEQVKQETRNIFEQLEKVITELKGLSMAKF